jgi:hypothetical protein
MAITTNGESQCLPNIACSRSDCSVFVGNHVEGHHLCTSIIINGNSVITARFMASAFKEKPGQLVAVTQIAQEYDHQIAHHTAAISSSA